MTTSQLPGFRTLMLGEGGSGKTTAIRTLIDCGITPFCIFTEQSFEVLGDIPSSKLHWKYISPVADSLESMMDRITDISTLTTEMRLKKVDMGRNKDNKLMDFVKALNSFTCDRTGENFGPVKTWGTDRALVVDSLSGWTTMAWGAVVGIKSGKAPVDYGVVQDELEAQIRWLCNVPRCHFVLTAHLEREVDEINGGSKLMAAAPGKKLAPALPKHFSDVFMAEKRGKDFWWTTINPNASLKARNLPLEDKIPPTFKTIVESWKSRGGVIEA